MDVRTAVQDKANYADIVRWFRGLGDLSPDELALLADTIDAMSEEIFEHYKALCDIMKSQLQRIRRVCREEGCEKAFPEDTMRHQLAYALGKTCEQKVILAEKYEDLVKGLKI